jgi:acid phosphatase type 7
MRRRFPGLGLVIIAAAPFAPTATVGPATAQTADLVLVAVGDISPDPSVATVDDVRTAELAVAANPTVVAVLGDEQYEDGAYQKFIDLNGYQGSWGRLKAKTCAVIGNHEYLDPPAGPAGFRAYFQPNCVLPRSGPGIPGVYVYTVGAWRVYVLDSECRHQWGTGPGCGRYDPMINWLRKDLQARRSGCQLGMWHIPRWGQGAPWGDDGQITWLWNVFSYWGGDLVLNGHEHAYARFTSMRENGTADPTFQGPRAITVGTGGRSLIAFTKPAHAGTRYRDDKHFGVLRLQLSPRGWSSEFRRTDGVVADRASAGCG